MTNQVRKEEGDDYQIKRKGEKTAFVFDFESNGAGTIKKTVF